MLSARRAMFMRMFSSALASQALLSAASFAVGLLLIRHTSDLQYGYFILVSGAIILAASLQSAFIAPALVKRMAELGRTESGDLTGGLYRGQQRVIALSGAAALGIVVGLWVLGFLETATLALVMSAIVAMMAALRREYFRMVLLAYRRAHEVLRGDFVYAALLVGGVVLAISSPAPAACAVLGVALAALVTAVLLSRILRRHEAWNADGAPGILREIAPLGVWSTAGAAIYWSFSQGYTYLVAGTLDVGAIAAIAATRLMAMPVNLLSAGIGSLMLPLASRWLHESGARVLLRRLTAFAVVIALIAVCYFAVLWVLRGWIFEEILRKHFAQRDALLLLWSASFVMMTIHQQLVYLLVARQRFRTLTWLALASAALALVSSYLGMLRFGGAGAPFGILIGEFVNTAGVVVLCLRETDRGGFFRRTERRERLAAQP